MLLKQSYYYIIIILGCIIALEYQEFVYINIEYGCLLEIQFTKFQHENGYIMCNCVFDLQIISPY